ncbi:MAG TPA: acetyl-CoA carboxylase biotin carboxyl carrier protein [Pyrinomonadaceae bacterium]|nr:acetyl-CoA carboxylase biotin carboxyl carrier protein [Pyrinomonadaceae bacterium]
MSNQHSEAEQSHAGAHTGKDARRSGRPDRRRRGRPSHLDPSVNMAELRELIALVQKNGFAEFEIEREGFRLHVRRDLQTAPAVGANSSGAASPSPAESSTATASSVSPAKTATPEHPGARAQTAAADDQDLHIISSPIVGTFYRAASPNADPFVKIGSQVEPDSIVCIIEAMKLMNEIQAETNGEVVKIYVENGQPVEYGQPLFGIRE